MVHVKVAVVHVMVAVVHVMVACCVRGKPSDGSSLVSDC